MQGNQNTTLMSKTKFTALAVATVLAGTCLSSQAKFSVGPKIGINVDKMHFNDKAFDKTNQVGFTVGAEAEYVTPVLGLGFDVSLMYSRLTKAGVRVEENFTFQDICMPYEKKGNFFEIPLHLKYKLGIPAVASIVKPYFFTGPTVAFQLGGGDSYFKTKKTQWGWDLGLGVELVKHLQIGAGYTFGLNKVADWTLRNSSHAVVDRNIKVRNNYWTVTAAWLF